MLTEKRVDILAVFKSNEPNIIRGLGFEVVLFEAADYGVPTLGLTYIVTQDLIDDRPRHGGTVLEGNDEGSGVRQVER